MKVRVISLVFLKICVLNLHPSSVSWTCSYALTRMIMIQTHYLLKEHYQSSHLPQRSEERVALNEAFLVKIRI